jgi:hypothetical protein
VAGDVSDENTRFGLVLFELRGDIDSSPPLGIPDSRRQIAAAVKVDVADMVPAGTSVQGLSEPGHFDSVESGDRSE